MMHAYMIREPERAYENPLLAGRETTTGMYATTRTEPLEWNAPSLTDIRGNYVLMPGGDGKGPRGGGKRNGSGGGSGSNQGGGRGGNRGGSGGGKKTGGGRGGC